MRRGRTPVALGAWLAMSGVSFAQDVNPFEQSQDETLLVEEALLDEGDGSSIRIYGFMLSSFMAGCGGIILASRLRSVSTDAGGGALELSAISAAVIGGTSLFGGSGRVVSALLGALVVASVENGMGLLGLSSGVKFVITGLVLLLAVLVDAISRRSRSQSGLA